MIKMIPVKQKLEIYNNNKIWDQRHQVFEEFLEDKLIVNNMNCIHILDLENIKYIKASGNYCEIVMTDNKQILSAKTLKRYEKALIYKNFLRVHSSFLINLSKVTGIKRNGTFTIIIDDNIEIPVSRGYKESLFSDFFNNFKNI